MNIITNKWAYYNDVDPKACAWARQLIKAGLVAPGEVDERSITEVEQSDLKGFVQHHFFSGILGWSYALRLAGWGDDRPVCTASLPCQPFSIAGQQKGKDDERHLLPYFIELVKQCNFQTIFGEQVSGAIKHGWLDDLCFEMERENYAVGSIVLTAAGAGAPHIRQRLYWVADSTYQRAQGGVFGRQDSQRETINRHVGCGSTVSRMADSENGDRGSKSQCASSPIWESWDKFGGSSAVSGLSIPDSQRHEQQQYPAGQDGCVRAESVGHEWTNTEWLYCRDNKYRPIKPASTWLVDGVSERMVRSGDTGASIDYDNTQEARVMRLKGYGNAIVPQVASEFIKAFMSINNE